MKPVLVASQFWAVLAAVFAALTAVFAKSASRAWAWTSRASSARS